MPLKINLKSIRLYVIYGVVTALLNYAVKGAPLSLGLCFAMLACGANLIVTPAVFIAASAVNLNLKITLICAFEGIFLALTAFLYRRTGRKLKYEAALLFAAALAPYIIFAPWLGIRISWLNEYAVKSVAAAVACVFAFFSFKCVYALIFRLGKCRLREDELVCIAAVYATAGAGLYEIAGQAAYICLCAAAIVFFTRLLKSPASILISLVLAVPEAISELNPICISAYVTIGAAALLFCNAGRFAPAATAGVLSAGYSYISGAYRCPTSLIIALALLLFFACFIPSLPSAKHMKELKSKLACREVLPEAAVARTRRRTGERLFRISELFKEIECAFMALDDDVDETAVRERMFSELKDKCCLNCDRAGICGKTGKYPGFKKLIDAGCVKGKVNLIDLPSEMTAACARPSDVMTELNAILQEYRRVMTENDNAKAGRRLLADQAHGVSEVMKSCAVDLSRTPENYSEAEDEIKKSLSSYGVSCPELNITGENGCEVWALICGDFNPSTVAGVISEVMRKKYLLKDKYSESGLKTCLVFGAPPRLDAAFGVACAVKNGESVSGDTHSVIRINERAFLMALSDGMGSGVYARKVSEAAISLIEAFYRAEIPEDTVLKTINKLLSFNRDERFACIDIAAVNLDSGRADFVKIGSPAGVIMRRGEIKVLESGSLPLGILDNLKPTVCSEQLKSGDIIVFMSDGITSAFPSSTELYEYLQGLKPLNPQNLADKILAEALNRTKRALSDDMTVLCTRLFDYG